MLKNFWNKLTGKKETAQEAPAASQEQNLDNQLKEFKGSKKDLLKMLRNPAAKQRVFEIMQRMSKDGVDTNNPQQIQQWIQTHKTELEGKNDQAPKTTQVVNTAPKIGRNDPCLCGSGKKYKRCCLTKKK